MSSYKTKARLEAEAVFNHPMDVVAARDLTGAEKVDALKRWQQSLQDRLRSTGEGMAPPAGQTADEAALIEEIDKALKMLAGEPKPRQS